jgi:dCMP deaminase
MSKNENRPSWDEYWFKIASDVLLRSTCLRRKVGAVIVKDNWLLSVGYNGAPAHSPHCSELGGCMRQELNVPSGEKHEICRAVHAEQNAIIQAAKHGVKIDGATLYVTAFPCNICAKMIANVGIKEIVYMGEYPDKLSKKVFEEAGIKTRLYK